MTTRHKWDKFAEHCYRCQCCGVIKTNIEQRDELGRVRWTAQFTHPDGRIEYGRTPLCQGVRDAAPAPQIERRSSGEWNAYVEAGATIQERRARLAEVPEALRDQVKDHLATVWALKDAARARFAHRG